MCTFQSLMYAIVSVVSGVIGASLHYIFSRFSEERKHQQNMRTEAYVDFFRAALGRTSARRTSALESEDKNKGQESAVLLNDAKIRIAIYGGKEVVQKIAEFCSAGGKTDTAEGKKLFVDICQAIRKESLGKKQAVLKEDIFKLFWNKAQGNSSLYSEKEVKQALGG